MNAPWTCTDALDPRARADIRERMALDHCKWDPQVGDVSVLAPYAIMLEPEAWAEIAAAAEALASEILDAEIELGSRPDLLRSLSLPRAFTRRPDPALAAVAGPRIVRFDFHLTTDGWKISEANTDVPGGLIESGPFVALMAEALDAHADAPPDPAQSLAAALASRGHRSIALVHATAYTDDRQVMVHLARALESAGCGAHLVAPDQIAWIDRRAHVRADPRTTRAADAIVRFFPAEWLPNLSAQCLRGFLTSLTPASNPPAALLTQSKRLPLIWDRLATPMPTWRSLLPDTRDPRRNPRRDTDWILKPALGRVGAGVVIPGVTLDRALRAARRSARLFPRHWIAQRRFDAVPLATPDGDRFPCLGLYVIDGRAAGIYGRLAPRPLIDHRAQDVAVLIAHPAHQSARTTSRRFVDERSTRPVPILGA